MNEEDAKMFYSLWKKGYRFLDERKLDDRSYGMSSEEDGEYHGYTINGLINLAKKHGSIPILGTELKPDEVELFFNIAVFVTNKKDAPTD